MVIDERNDVIDDSTAANLIKKNEAIQQGGVTKGKSLGLTSSHWNKLGNVQSVSYLPRKNVSDLIQLAEMMYPYSLNR